MKEYKAGWRYYFFLTFFIGVVLLGMRVIFMLLAGRISDENGQLTKTISYGLAIMIGIVLSTHVLTVFNLLKQIILHKGSVVTLSDYGIENTVVFINLFAFMIVVPVKIIPWEAVTYYDEDYNPYIRVDVTEVECGGVAKLLLKVLGYHFCLSFVKPEVTSMDLLMYKERFNLKY